MVERACKSSEDGQSQKQESVAYGTYEEDLYEELLANTSGKCQKTNSLTQKSQGTCVSGTSKH